VDLKTVFVFMPLTKITHWIRWDFFGDFWRIFLTRGDHRKYTS